MNKHLILVALFCGCIITSNAQSIAQTRCDNFKKGVNLSNWLEGYWETNWPDTATYTYSFLAELKNAGITSVRLPVCFALVTDTVSPYNVDTTNRVFSIVDSVIYWTTQLNMNLIIDNHHQWNITDTTWRPQVPRLAHLWAVLANRYKNLDPNRYFFEILNEPNGIKNDTLPFLFNPVIDSIRQFAPYHSIIVSPTVWDAGIAYLSFKPLTDTNLIYTFHSYDPYPFTHQGLSFVVPPLPTGVPYPNSGYDFAIPANWAAVLQWRDSFNLPMFLGEFGVGIGADANSRCNWIDTVTKHINSTGMSSFYWDVVGDFKWFRSGVASQDSIFPCFKHALGLYGDTLTAVQNVPDETDLKIFPNPAQNNLTVQTLYSLTNARYIIANEVGGVVQTGYLNAAITNIQLSSLSNGIYFLQIQHKGSSINRKFIIDR